MRLIDADALMQSLGITDMDCNKCEWYDREWSNCKRGGDFEDTCCAIEHAPTIEPERKIGKWIYIDDDNLLYDSYWCSECKKTITVDSERRDDIGITIEDLAFCPNCGARMVQEEDNGQNT